MISTSGALSWRYHLGRGGGRVRDAEEAPVRAVRRGDLLGAAYTDEGGRVTTPHGRLTAPSGPGSQVLSCVHQVLGGVAGGARDHPTFARMENHCREGN